MVTRIAGRLPSGWVRRAPDRPRPRARRRSRSRGRTSSTWRNVGPVPRALSAAWSTSEMIFIVRGLNVIISQSCSHHECERQRRREDDVRAEGASSAQACWAVPGAARAQVRSGSHLHWWSGTGRTQHQHRHIEKIARAMHLSPKDLFEGESDATRSMTNRPGSTASPHRPKPSSSACSTPSPPVSPAPWRSRGCCCAMTIPPPSTSSPPTISSNSRRRRPLPHRHRPPRRAQSPDAAHRRLQPAHRQPASPSSRGSPSMPAPAAKPVTGDALERLCRYIARPAVSNERISVNDRRQVMYRLKHSSGTAPPMSCSTPSTSSPASPALVPRPRAHLTRYHGVFAPNCKHRHRIIPNPPTNPPVSLIRLIGLP